MKNKLVNREQAEKLKELGFDEDTFMGFDTRWASGRLRLPASTNYYGAYSGKNKHIIKAPNKMDAIKWLLDKIYKDNKSRKPISIRLYGDESGEILPPYEIDSYGDAFVFATLDEALDLLFYCVGK